jgi:hypothetical protein
MLRVVTSVAFALSLLGCGTAKGERVALTITQLPVSGCHPLATPLYLVADPQYGTATKFNLGDTMAEPLYWPTGYTGWRVGSEVEVRDTRDNVVAVTGHRYDIYVTVDSGVEAPGRIAVAGCIRPSELGD